MYKSPKGSDFLVIFLLGLLGLREQVYTWSSLRSQRKRPHQDLFPEQPLADPGKVRVRSSRKESVSSGGERHHVYSQLFRKPWITLVQSSCPSDLWTTNSHWLNRLNWMVCLCINKICGNYLKCAHKSDTICLGLGASKGRP